MFHSDKSWTRRDLLRIISLAGLIIATPSPDRAASTFGPDIVTISIVHTIDLHGAIPPAVDGEISDSTQPFSSIVPCLIKEIAGMRIAMFGLTSPGMLFWFRPEFIRSLKFLYPIEPVRRAMVQANSQESNAIVLVGSDHFRRHKVVRKVTAGQVWPVAA
jgi:2',3'-cyclic-nucleotide 2'-phosphodiesterase (5'-nucleotidase family)